MSTMAGVRVTDDDEHEGDQRALREVKEFEGEGRVINDWYSKAEYIHRRHGFLGKHPDYQTLPKLDQSATCDADTVFYLASSSKLSAQEVRRRELKFEVFPLLPLPTSDNMETLDDFRGYPMDEWLPGDEYAAVGASPLTTMDPLALHQSGGPVRPQTDMPAHATTQSRYFNGEGGQIAYFVPQQTSSNAGLHPSFNLNDTHTSPSAPTSTSTMENMENTTNAEGQQGSTISPAVLRQLTAAFGKPRGSLGPSDAPEQYQHLWANASTPATSAPAQETDAPSRWTPAASLAGNPVASPVKSPPNNKKRSSPDDRTDIAPVAPREDTAQPDATGQTEPDVISQPEKPAPPAKKRKLTPKQSPPATPGPDEAQTTIATRRKKPTNSTAQRSVEATSTLPATKTPPRKRKATAKAAANSTNGESPSSTPAATATSPKATIPPRKSRAIAKAAPDSSNVDSPSSTPAATITPEQLRTLERVAAGEILPKSIKIAKEAQALRLRRLLADPSRKNRKKHHPEFPPEFFDPHNFKRFDVETQNVVRCVCGDRDDKRPDADINWDGCDTDGCLVWQHKTCVGDATPKIYGGDKYYCHMCDPFRHRKKLQQIRKAAG